METAASIATNLDAIATLAAVIVGYLGIAIIVYGALKNGWSFIICCVRKPTHLPEIRVDLGKHLALGLEFLISKDIILSIMEPTWDDLGKLAVLVTIRTVVGLVLMWELKEVKEEIEEERVHRQAVKMLKK